MTSLKKGAIRHPKFAEKVNDLALQFPRAQEIIDGAVWEISRDPRGIGIYIEQLDVWQARLVLPPILLLYSIAPRYVYMLTILPADDTISL